MLKLVSNSPKWAIYVLLLFFFNINAIANSHRQDNPARFVHGVISITQDHQYVRKHDAPIYWKIIPYYISQPTNASCSLTSATMIINAARIQQIRYVNQPLATTNRVMLSNPEWAKAVKENAQGVNLEQLGLFLKQAMHDFNVGPTQIEIIHATHSKNTATKFHQTLLRGEKTGKTFIIVNFDIKFISGTESVGHFAPVGAYDVSKKRVLIMDPYRELFEPYWVPERQLLESMQTQDASVHKNRGFIIVTVK